MKILGIILLVVFCISCSNPKTGNPDFTIQYDTIAGVDNNLLSLDIYVPDNPQILPSPVVIWVHGGGWRQGDKLNQMEYKQSLFNDLGYTLVSINYRLSPFDFELSNPDRIMYPLHNMDLAKGIAWTYHHIHEFGGDSSKMVLLGHSAGAHLVALTATDESFLQAEGLDLSILDGVGSFDTEAYDIFRSQKVEYNELFTNAFGYDTDVWKMASPIYHVDFNKNIPPRFLFSERGGELRKNILHDFSDSLSAIGTQVTIINANSLSHEEVNESIGKEGDLIMTPPIIQFLSECFQ